MISRYFGLLASKDRDSFRLKNILFAVIFAVGIEVVLYAEYHAADRVLTLIFWVMFLVYCLFGFGFLMAAAVNIFRRKLKAGLSAFLASAVCVGLPACAPLPFYLIDLSRLTLFENHYLGVVKSVPTAEGAPHVHFFAWGSSGSFNIEYVFYLVYDDSGQITLPRERRSAVWNQKAINTYPLLDDGRCQSEATYLRNSFYSVMTLCQ